MTLEEWSLKTNIFPQKLTKSRCVYVWCDLLEPIRKELWHLSDYRVSTATGLTVYLMPK